MRKVLSLVLALAASAPANWAGAQTSEATAQESRAIRWLALGDSFSSGEGIPGADAGNPDLQGKETCQRANGDSSNAKAYSVVAVETLQTAPVPGLNFERPFFVACTGAISDDVDRQINEMRSLVPPELQRWDLVSLSFGGNNILFADVLKDCLDVLDAWGLLVYEGCSTSEQRLRDRVDMLVGKRDIVDREYNGSMTLPMLYDRVAGVVASGGHVIVAGYPHLIEEPGRWASWVDRSGMGCQGVLRRDIEMLRSVTGYLNEQIALAVEAANQSWRDRGVEFHFVDLATEVYETSDNPGDRHGLCTNDQWINGITVGLTSGDVRTDRSFHPTQNGHVATGHRIADILRELTFRQPDTDGGESEFFVCEDSCSVSSNFGVLHPSFGDLDLVVTVTEDQRCQYWPGFTQLLAVSPSGEIRWKYDIGCIFEFALADTPQDETGHVFFRYSFGRDSGVVVLAPTRDGFDDFGSLLTVPDGELVSGWMFPAHLQDLDGDGTLEIVLHGDDDGQSTGAELRWTGRDYSA